MKSSILDELAEIRTQCSIIGLSCAQMMKIKLQTVKKDDNYSSIKMLDSALTRLLELVVNLEKLVGELDDST